MGLELTYWHWWIIGVVLIVLEIFAPGAFFLWMGISAAVVGVVLLVAPDMGWEYQFMIFAVFSIVSIALWKRYAKTTTEASDHPNLNRRGEQYVGRIFTLDEPIVNGLGKIRVDDSTWKISGDDCAAGARVKVTGIDGTILKVELN
jgi:membrane protein implicated in regulation of membrane protease activity